MIAIERSHGRQARHTEEWIIKMKDMWNVIVDQILMSAGTDFTFTLKAESQR